MIVENYEPKTKIEYDEEEIVTSVLNKVRRSVIDFHAHPNPANLNAVPRKYISKTNKMVAEIKNENEMIKKDCKKLLPTSHIKNAVIIYVNKKLLLRE